MTYRDCLQRLFRYSKKNAREHDFPVIRNMRWLKWLCFCRLLLQWSGSILTTEDVFFHVFVATWIYLWILHVRVSKDFRAPHFAIERLGVLHGVWHARALGAVSLACTLKAVCHACALMAVCHAWCSFKVLFCSVVLCFVREAFFSLERHHKYIPVHNIHTRYAYMTKFQTFAQSVTTV